MDQDELYVVTMMEIIDMNVHNRRLAGDGTAFIVPFFSKHVRRYGFMGARVACNFAPFTPYTPYTHPRWNSGRAFPKPYFLLMPLGFVVDLKDKLPQNRGVFFIVDVLDQLSAQQRTLIVSMPYRAGLWVSHSDDEGGDEAHEKELTALANLIDGFSQQVFGSEMLQYIMHQTLARKDEWESWSGDIDKVPEECKQALEILRAHVDEKDVKVYAMRLMELGEAVAVAFREHDDPVGAGSLNCWRRIC
ncbi:MAG: hypothetical protein H6861_07195 [Rhodospirillales bacterium]|nr:hypothetical protein [Rhodospirillales bacterium]